MVFGTNNELSTVATTFGNCELIDLFDEKKIDLILKVLTEYEGTDNKFCKEILATLAREMINFPLWIKDKEK